MKSVVLWLCVFAILPPVLRGADSLSFTCNSQIFNAKDFDSANDNGIVDIGKLSVLPHPVNIVSTFKFTKNDSTSCSYKVEDSDAKVVKAMSFTYPSAGDNSTAAEMDQKLRGFVNVLRGAGLLQYEGFVANKPLSNVLADYVKLPTPQTDRYLQFRNDSLVYTTIVVTDPAEEKILYRIVVPKNGDNSQVFETMTENFKNSLKAQGKSDAQIAMALTKFQPVITALKRQMQILGKQHQLAQFETYSYDP